MVILPLLWSHKRANLSFQLMFPSADSKMSPVTLSFENLILLDCGLI